MGDKNKIRKITRIAYHALRNRETDRVVVFGEILGDILDLFRTKAEKRRKHVTENNKDDTGLNPTKE